MEIIKKSRELSKVELYKMTMDAGIESMNRIEDGTLIDVDAVVTFIDTNSNGEEVKITSVMDKDGNVFAFQSETFRHSLENIMSIMDGDDFSIIKESGKTKSGRSFINCRLA